MRNINRHVARNPKKYQHSIIINYDPQQKHPFLMVSTILRGQVVRMVLKHRLGDTQTIQQAGPFQRRDRYNPLK